jgi:hypothetical protein
MTLFTVPQTLPFGVAMLVVIGIGVIEVLGLVAAASLSQLIDHHVHLDHGAADGPLGWLHVGKLPVLVLLILFLLGFAISGYAIQLFCHRWFGLYLPALLAVLPAGGFGLVTLRMLGGALARILPQDETSAVSERSLIGRAGVVVTGTARQGMAAEVKVRDQHGNLHFLMLEPYLAGEEFEQGCVVLVVSRQGALYRGVRSTHPDHAADSHVQK